MRLATTAGHQHPTKSSSSLRLAHRLCSGEWIAPHLNLRL